MRISLFLNATMSKSCARSHSKQCLQDEKPQTYVTQNYIKPMSYKASNQVKSLNPNVGVANHFKQLPGLLNSCYELQWFVNSRITFSDTFNVAIKQIYSLSALLLLYLTLVLLLVQVVGLALILSCAGSLPVGFQFMLAAVLFIASIAFKIMH